MTINDTILEAEKLLAGIHEDTQSPQDKELLRTAFDALRFIWSAGHVLAFEEYRNIMKTEGPSLVVAAFDTYEQADAWIQNNPNPPHLAYVLVGDTYYIVFDFRPTNRRGVFTHPTLEFYLEKMMEEGLPPAVASFNTRQEARAWFSGLSEKPSQAVIDIGGERHLMAYHPNIDHLAFHPFSLVQQRFKKDPNEQTK